MVNKKPKKESQKLAQCSIDNTFDSNVLAISWQPAFCQGRNQSECAGLTSQRYDATHFTLHGLWPNKKACGSSYGSCGVVKKKPSSFCKYPELTLTPDTRTALGIVMPSSAYGTCLQRHEWWKHGTCSGLDQEEYFSLAITLLEQINQSDFVEQFISKQTGNILTRASFKQAFEESFGIGAYDKIALQCNRNGLLKEIQIALPKDINSNSKLRNLLSAENLPNKGKGSCKDSFELKAVL